MQEAYSTISEISQETFSGIRVVMTFVKEAHFLKKFSDANDDYRSANMELVKVFGFFFPLVTFLSGITTLILLRYGGERVLDGSMSPGDFVAMFSYLQMLVWPMVGAGCGPRVCVLLWGTSNCSSGIDGRWSTGQRR